MSIVALVGNLAFTLANIIVGIRMCLLARRTRQLPELLIGASFLTGGIVANTLRWLVFALKPREPYLSVMNFTVRVGAAATGIMLLVMAWRVFRPGSRWAKACVGVGSALLVVYTVRDLVLPHQTPAEVIRHPLHWMNVFALMAPYVWVAWESTRYQMSLERRARIGLPADLLVAAQMRLWALSMGSIAAMLLAIDVMRVFGVMTGHQMSPANVISVLGVLATVSLWMAFFTPRWYVRRIRSREI